MGGDPPEYIPNWPPSQFVLNGITFAPKSRVALANGECFEDTGAIRGTFNPFYIAAHELGHAVHNFGDTYGNSPEKVLFGLYGGNRGPYHLDPFQKSKVGWLSPIVPVQDGWVDIPDVETSNQAIILSEPSHWGDEFFIVENRYAGESYDNVSLNFNPPRVHWNHLYDYLLPDQGLFVWHIDKTPPAGESVIQLLHRDGLPGSGPETDRYYYRDAAFSGDDPKEPDDLPYYDLYDDSIPEDTRWRDGSQSSTGIWAVSPSAETMKAYVDVTGPGVFIQYVGDTHQAKKAGTGGKNFTFRIGNTGDESATFDVSVIGLDSRLSMYTTPPVPVTIPAKSIGGTSFGLSFNDTAGGFIDTFFVKVTRQDMTSITDQVEMEITVCDENLSAPTLTSPKGGMLVDGSSTTLYWATVSGAVTQHDVEVCENSTCSIVARSADVTGSSWQITPPPAGQ